MNRVAIVTGGTSGIGEAVVETIARAGFTVEFCARRPDQIAQHEARWTGEGLSVTGSVCDVTDEDQVDRYVKEVVERRGPVTCLVNSAGTSGGGPFHTLPTDVWRHIMATNADSVFLMCRSVIRDGSILDTGRGRIVNIASTAGKQGIPMAAPYNASKHAVIGLTRSLALEYARRGLTVNAVCPGYVETPMAHTVISRHAAISGRGESEIRTTFEEQIPIGRYATAAEVAELVGHLVRPEAAAITGQAVNVCGGLGRF